MIVKTININTPQIITIGRQLENNYRQFIFDCSSFGGVSATLVHQRSEDVAPYNVSTGTDKVVWTVSNTDTAYPGYGQAELRITLSDGLAKSIIFQTLVIESITAQETIPAVLQSWYDAMIQWIDENSITQEELDDAVAEYIAEHPITELDPVFLASPAHGITNTDITNWNNKSTFSGSYTDLTNKPTIPSKTSDLVNDSGFTTFSGNYNDLSNKPTIPTKTSDLTNDSGFGTYSKPSGGIPKTDLATAVQTSLEKADSALQSAPVTSVNGQTGDVTVTDTNTTYTISISNNVITLTPSSGTAQTITPSNATTSVAGYMSATDKSHLDDVYADYSSALVALGVI